MTFPFRLIWDILKTVIAFAIIIALIVLLVIYAVNPAALPLVGETAPQPSVNGETSTAEDVSSSTATDENVISNEPGSNEGFKIEGFRKKLRQQEGHVVDNFVEALFSQAIQHLQK